jgi:hypothetical protein
LRRVAADRSTGRRLRPATVGHGHRSLVARRRPRRELPTIAEVDQVHGIDLAAGMTLPEALLDYRAGAAA